ncbi:SDR family NAD(P)-dependent oxidoreductase [Enemella evansiae]|uniref:SDR family NAD(P)-dependent oxidoreductase n=1 Tax=Enemella evansiae TaxID=2016499 RepID=UPI000B9723C0|nr:SDR family oxidoreductase [Enemella evansiae]OYN99880.1 short-chain dehydrogenase [Enemella evansiae]OYO16097.1 short-chain dehydrogenase [Enemella evansiae]TDO91797.1 NAD(P)-dependent dehydrogenase (short-subunit alcohol dehydrogenase family) [Enemella evansiae]
MSEFDGIRALVTGGAQGIGGATASELMRRGARVAVLDLDPDGAPEGAIQIRCDVGDTDDVNRAVGEAVGQLGGLDVVVNNAGIGAQGDVAANDDAEWQRVLNINVRGMARVAAAALPALRESEHAAIVNVASIAATAGLPERVLYSASKGAIYSMTLAMAADHAREGIRVNAVCPGTAHTPWISNLLAKAADPDEELRQLNLRQPHLRLVEPEEVAGAICYLASPSSGSTIGVALAVDGGMQGLRLRPPSA